MHQLNLNQISKASWEKISFQLDFERWEFSGVSNGEWKRIPHRRAIVGKASSSMTLSVVCVNFKKTSVWRWPESARRRVYLDKLWQVGWCRSWDNSIADASDLVRDAFRHRKPVQLEKERSDMITAWSFQDQSSCWILNFLKGLDSLVWYIHQ